MHDRGDKIVSLAREILRSDGAPFLPTPPPSRITLSFRALCLATVLTALGASAVTAWSFEKHRTLTRYERTELDALVFYAARQKSLNEEILRQNILAQLHLTNFDSMTENDFILARNYLHSQVD